MSGIVILKVSIRPRRLPQMVQLVLSWREEGGRGGGRERGREGGGDGGREGEK